MKFGWWKCEKHETAGYVAQLVANGIAHQVQHLSVEDLIRAEPINGTQELLVEMMPSQGKPTWFEIR